MPLGAAYTERGVSSSTTVKAGSMNWEGDGDLRVTVANLMIVLENGITSLMTASLEGE